MSIETSPFVFEGPVPPELFAGREAELAALRDRAAHGRFCLLYGPRRYGKTSLIARLAADAADDRDLAVLRVDLQGVLSLDDVSRRLAAAYGGLDHHRLRPALTRLLAALAEAALRAVGRRAGVDLGYGIIRAEDTPPASTLEALLGVPWDAAGRTGTRVLVVLDEFQAIADVERADAVLRSKIQHQRERVSYLFCGSEQGVLRALFSDRAAPLYGQAERFELGPLPAVVAADYVAARFAETGRDAGVALGPLVQVAAGHPQRLNLLAHHLWNHVPDEAAATGDDWLSALETTLAYVDPELVAVWAALSTSQRKALRLAAWGEAPFGAAARRLGLGSGSAQAARQALERRSVLNAAGQIVDPLLGLWIRRQHPAP